METNPIKETLYLIGGPVYIFRFHLFVNIIVSKIVAGKVTRVALTPSSEVTPTTFIKLFQVGVITDITTDLSSVKDTSGHIKVVVTKVFNHYLYDDPPTTVSPKGLGSEMKGGVVIVLLQVDPLLSVLVTTTKVIGDNET